MKDPSPAVPVPKAPRGWPLWTLSATILLAALAAAIRLLHETLVDYFAIDPGFLLAGCYLLVILAWLTWVGWLLFRGPGRFGRRALAATALFAAPVAFFTLFQPKFRGSMQLDGLEFRFQRTKDASQTFEAARQIANLPTGDRASFEGSFAGFLGDRRDGALPGPALEHDWVRHPPELLWKRSVGAGWSGCAVRDGYLWTMEQRGDRELVTCYQLNDGEPVWEFSNEQRHEDAGALGRFGPRATPQLDGDMVYAQGGAGRLFALRASDGELVWQADLCELLGIRLKEMTNSAGLKFSQEDSTLMWGRAASPLIVDDMIIVAGGHPRGNPESGATLVAFDKVRGEVRWKTGAAMIAYGSPALATLAGRRQILITGENESLGFDAETGRQLWSWPRPGHSDGDANCSQATPVEADKVLLTKGYMLGGELVRLTPDGEQMKPEQVWTNSRVLRTKLTNPVIRDGHAYSISDGFLECARLADGGRVWKKRGNYGDGQLLLVGSWLVVQGESGFLQLVEAVPTEPRQSKVIDSVDGLCWNTLAISGDLLVVRSDLELACFRLPTLETATTTAGPDSNPAGENTPRD